MTQSTREERFLERLVEKLHEEGWGTIEPKWFDPMFIRDAQGDDEEVGWARDLQEIVRDTLHEVTDGGVQEKLPGL